jgi:hypothetical protein
MGLDRPHGLNRPSTLGTRSTGARLEAAGLPATWTRVLERNPEAMTPRPMPGYVWLDASGKVLHVDERMLEFRDSEPSTS